MNKTRETIEAIIFFILCVSLTIMITMFVKTESEKGEIYAMGVHVVDCDTRTDIVVCEDCNGNLWEFEGVEDWQVGDCAAFVMNNCGTKTIYDDEIISVRYECWD